MSIAAFETPSVRMEAVLILRLQAPREDVARIMAEIDTLTSLTIGHYDGNAYQSASGIERYRPLQGAAAGAEAEIRERPDVVEVSFQLPHDPRLLERVVESIFRVHSYQEPCIVIEQALASRSKGLDDSRNPHRWWNTTGDWKREPAAGS